MRRNLEKKYGKKFSVIIMMLVLCLMSSLVLTGCGSSGEGTGDGGEETPEPVIYVNPLTGAESKEPWAARPVQVSIDNVGDAIPQSWLSKADLVYEFPVEGKQSRLQAIYYSQFPEEFGPIRSTRPYFVDLTREYKAIFVAHGWSPQAKEYLQSNVVPYINAMNSSCDFYRVSDKTSPHNSYLAWSEVEAKIEEKGWWDEQQEIRPFTFLEEGAQNEGAAATYIEIDYGASDCEYTYDAETGLYTRTVNGTAYVDHETGESIKVNNILVQNVTSSVLDKKGRLEIDMCAGGNATLFTNGVAVEGTWSRADLDSRTIFVDAEGNEFQLSTGTSWVNVVDQNTSVSYQ